jgi:hypothetical protein
MSEHPFAAEFLHVAGPAAACDPPLDLQGYLGPRLYEANISMVLPDWAHRFDAHLGWQQWCQLCGALMQPRTEWVFEAGSIVLVDSEGLWQPDPPSFWDLPGLSDRLCLPGVVVDPPPGPGFLGLIHKPDPALVAAYGRPYPVLTDLDPEVRSSIFRRPDA